MAADAPSTVAMATDNDDKVTQTDNGPTPEDGPQDDVPQGQDVVVVSDVEDDDDIAVGQLEDA